MRDVMWSSSSLLRVEREHGDHDGEAGVADEMRRGETALAVTLLPQPHPPTSPTKTVKRVAHNTHARSVYRMPTGGRPPAGLGFDPGPAGW